MKRILFLLLVCFLSIGGYSQGYGRILSVPFGAEWEEAMNIVRQEHSIHPKTGVENQELEYANCPFEGFEASSIKLLFHEGRYYMSVVEFAPKYNFQVTKTYDELMGHLLKKYGKRHDYTTGKDASSTWWLPWGAEGEDVTQIVTIKAAADKKVQVTWADRKLLARYKPKKEEREDALLKGSLGFWDIPFGTSKNEALKIVREKAGRNGTVKVMENFLLCYNCPFEGIAASKVRLLFEDDRLQDITATLSSREDTIVEHYKNLVNRFTAQYGRPLSIVEKYKYPYKTVTIPNYTYKVLILIFNEKSLCHFLR